MEKNGTNTEMLGKPSKFTEVESKAGRPRINRKLILRNLKRVDQIGNRRYTNTQIARMAGCSARTVKRIWNEAVESGEITEAEQEAKILGVIEADFESECQRATGMSFRDWLHTKWKTSGKANSVFNFCSKVWSQVFDSCSLVEFRDLDVQLADQMALKFVLAFKDDNKRMRGRLQHVRFLFRFLSRRDVADRHLTMSDSKHPRSKRRVAEISNTDFGKDWERIEERMVEELGEEIRLLLRFKICTQMRTGSYTDERELYGLKKGSESASYLYMTSPNDYQIHIFAKKMEEWDIIWMPLKVKEALWEKYQQMENGEPFITFIKPAKFIKTLRRVSEEVLGRELILHDLRKISLTWLYVMGVPLEVAVNINVGWKDTNTALSNYLDVKKVLRKSKRTAYRENIPEWFKEGLDDFTGFEAVIGSHEAIPKELYNIQESGVNIVQCL